MLPNRSATRELQWSLQWAAQIRKEEPIPKSDLSWDSGLQLTLMNVECLVIVHHQCTVNTSIDFVHTARRSMGFSRNRSLFLREGLKYLEETGEKS